MLIKLEKGHTEPVLLTVRAMELNVPPQNPKYSPSHKFIGSTPDDEGLRRPAAGAAGVGDIGSNLAPGCLERERERRELAAANDRPHRRLPRQRLDHADGSVRTNRDAHQRAVLENLNPRGG